MKKVREVSPQNLEQVRSFVAVAEEGAVVRAARRLLLRARGILYAVRQAANVARGGAE